MRMYMFCIGLLMGLLFATASSASAAPDFDTLLREADTIRTADPARFSHLVVELNLEAQGATPAQRKQLQLLNAYRSSMAGDLQASIHDLTSLLDENTDTDLRFRAGALLANIYALTRNFTEGLKVLDHTLTLLAEVKDRDVRHQGLLAASVLYNQVGQYNLGQHYAERVLEDEPADRAQCFAGNLRLEALAGEGKAPDDASYMAAISRCKAINEAVALNLVRSYLAKKWYAEGRTVEAIKLLEAHLSEVQSTGYRHLIGEFHALIAEYRLAAGDLASAQSHANAAVEQTEGYLHTLPLVMAYRTLYSVAEQRGNIADALDFHIRYAQADKAYLNEIKARELAYQLVQHEARQQSQQIELLNKQNEVLQLQQRVSDQKAQSSSLLILLLVVLAGSIGYWALKVKRVQVSLRRMAETDALTGIFNRHHFTHESDKSLTQNARAGEDVALIMFDLDHFKSINDRFGHDTGDWVLKRVAENCKKFCRRIDHLGRIGGEEFAILLSGCDLRGATRVAEDCRVGIASIDTSPSGRSKFVITASFGVTASSLSGYDLTKLLSHADQMLYRAKREGRNRVATFDGQVQQWTQLQAVRAGGQAAAESADIVLG